MFEPDYNMKELCEETILPEFGEYSYIHEDCSKPELIVFRIRDPIDILISILKINVNNID